MSKQTSREGRGQSRQETFLPEFLIEWRSTDQSTSQHLREDLIFYGNCRILSPDGDCQVDRRKKGTATKRKRKVKN